LFCKSDILKSYRSTRSQEMSFFHQALVFYLNFLLQLIYTLCWRWNHLVKYVYLLSVLFPLKFSWTYKG